MTDKRESICLDSAKEEHYFNDKYPLYCLLNFPKNVECRITKKLLVALDFIVQSFVRTHCRVDNNYYLLCYLCLAFAFRKLLPSLLAGKTTRYLREYLYSKQEYFNCLGRKKAPQKEKLKQKSTCFCKQICYQHFAIPPTLSLTSPVLNTPQRSCSTTLALAHSSIPPAPSSRNRKEIRTNCAEIDRILFDEQEDEPLASTGRKRSSPGIELALPDTKKFKEFGAAYSPEGPGACLITNEKENLAHMLEIDEDKFYELIQYCNENIQEFSRSKY